MSPETRAEAYFQKFSGPDGAEVLKQMIGAAEPTFEDEWLDFKSGIVREADIPRIWSRALSAFANNEGGVLIWGVDASKDPNTGIDVARSIVPVPNIHRLKSRLVELTPFATDPPIQGISIQPLPVANDSGFLICLIPEGTIKPYRAESAGKQFYVRVSGSSKECTVSLLRLLFHPRRHTRLDVVMSAVKKRHPDYVTLGFTALLENTGLWTARGIVTTIHSTENLSLLGDWDHVAAYSTLTGRLRRESLPGTRIPILETSFGERFLEKFGKSEVLDKTKVANFTFTLYADDAPPCTGSFSFVGEELAADVQKRVALKPIIAT